MNKSGPGRKLCRLRELKRKESDKKRRGKPKSSGKSVRRQLLRRPLRKPNAGRNFKR